jgi:choline dehydrogenase
MSSPKVADYIVVGGGSAGCAVASRLSEHQDVSVALVEEGPRDWNPYIHLPVTYYKTAKGKLLHRYPYVASAAQPEHKFPTMVQARVLGGGSSVNAMIYVRGTPADYDGWARAGADGWSFSDVLPYFLRAEDNERFLNAMHGIGGPLGVSDQRYTHPLTKAWLQACQRLGMPFNPDFNSGDQTGCGLYQVTTRNGRRSSAAVAYLKAARRRGNLSIFTGRKVLRVLTEKDRAIGIEYVENGSKQCMLANREVILSSGALNTPKLMMLSGIGRPQELSKHGVTVVHDLPGVGQNLQDHMEMSLIYVLSGPHSYDRYKKLPWQVLAGLQYALFKEGPVTSNVVEGGAFWWSDKGDPLPDLQFFFLPGAGVEDGVDTVPGGNGCTLSVTQTRPQSRGYVGLHSAEPSDAPLIAPNYLTDRHDLECMMDGARIAQETMSQRSLSPYIARGHIPAVPLQTRADLERFVRREAHPGLHPCGTCRIGTDTLAVVDPDLRVRGMQGLRIADASVIPTVVSGNLNAVAIMVGEKAADHILGRFVKRIKVPSRDIASAQAR